MDLKKIRQNKRKGKTKEIWYAVTGALNEQDGGMVALQMATYLYHRYKKPVLYLDCSMGSQMEHLERSEKSNNHRGEQGRFVFERNGITVVKRVAPQEADNWRGRGFYFVVCCFGNQHPALSGCLFDGYFYSGAVTEYTLEQWKCCLAAAQRDQNNYLVLTGGEEELAKQEFGHQCSIHKIPTFFHAFKYTKTLGRAWKRLFNGK